MIRKLSERMSFVCGRNKSLKIPKDEREALNKKNPNANFERKCTIEDVKTSCWLRNKYDGVNYCMYSENLDRMFREGKE